LYRDTESFMAPSTGPSNKSHVPPSDTGGMVTVILLMLAASFLLYIGIVICALIQ